MRQVGEPSVEEILASIKNVIARDNRDGAALERRERTERGLARGGRAQAPDDADEVLELDAATAITDDADDDSDDSPLLDAGVASSMRDSLAALAMLAEPGVAPQIVRSGETSLEGLTRELLRPALAEWLDRNLPPLVERMVAAEIARIVGKKG
ncbi:DUF2497 domain-containing protein [Novosphingobium sp.]|uniref:DUF2497 domain-containing protein n=1 Tax=Novosphingobium sp. TaxID=1874826 RepID=UPI0027357B56|nr:DUF2497 domain-containing protein [Novosphingobium sp.]MDP3906287.1 DUF2497 domain-containing protein [Novosphingobium sp.]